MSVTDSLLKMVDSLDESVHCSSQYEVFWYNIINGVKKNTATMKISISHPTCGGLIHAEEIQTTSKLRLPKKKTLQNTKKDRVYHAEFGK